MQVPVGTPADLAFGGAVLALGAAALLVMGHGFSGGRDERKRGGFGIPDAPSARRARDERGRTTWGGGKKDGKDDGKDDGNEGGGE